MECRGPASAMWVAFANMHTDAPPNWHFLPIHLLQQTFTVSDRLRTVVFDVHQQPNGIGKLPFVSQSFVDGFL
jgi:hypothetical protein